MLRIAVFQALSDALLAYHHEAVVAFEGRGKIGKALNVVPVRVAYEDRADNTAAIFLHQLLPQAANARTGVDNQNLVV